MGVVIGDGCILENKGTIKINVLDYDFALAFRSALEKWSGRSISMPVEIIRKNRVNHYWDVSFHSKEAAYFMKNFKLKQILNSDEKIRGAFIRGFADSEGCVSLTKRIIICNTNWEHIILVRKVIDSLGIKTYFRGHDMESGKKLYDITITNRRNLMKYYQKIGFDIKRKENNLKKILRGFKVKEWTDTELEFLRDMWGNVSDKMIAYSLSRRVASIRSKVRELRCSPVHNEMHDIYTEYISSKAYSEA